MLSEEQLREIQGREFPESAPIDRFVREITPNASSESFTTSPHDTSLIGCCKSLREGADYYEKQVKALMKSPDLSVEGLDQDAKIEAVANIVLAFRHFEDGRMRLGKVIQAMSGGVSVYDKTPIDAPVKLPGVP